MKRRTSFLTFFVVAVALISLQGCLSTETAARGGLRGSVLDQSGKPISGARVYTPGASAMTDVAGLWSLSDLEPQIQTVTVEREGYEISSRNIEVRSGQVGEGANFVLIEKGTIYNIRTSDLTSGGVVINFASRVLLRGSVAYGLNTLYDHATTQVSTGTVSHRFVIAGLTPATTYHFSCVGIDEKERTFRSTDQTFTTAWTRRGDPPTNVSITKEVGADIIAISWSADTGGDLAGYRVYRSSTENGSYTSLEAGLIKNTRYLDAGVSPGEKVFYRISRISGTGEESPKSAAVSLILPGITRGSVVWSPDQGPMILSGDLTIRQDSSLTILPGVSIGVTASDTWDTDSTSDRKVELKISGSLIVEGNSANPVSFTSLSGNPTPGDWMGISFDRNSNLNISRIAGLSVAFAKNGIIGNSGLPRITGSRISNCSDSGIECQAARIPLELTGNVIESCNCGMRTASNTAQSVTIASNTVIRCYYGIVSRDNLRSDIVGNTIQFWSIAGLDVGNPDSTSRVRLNVAAPAGNGSAIIARGKDEIRRNTLQGNVGVEVRDPAAVTVRSNLILTDNAKNCIGVLYAGPGAYSAASHVFQNNDIWNQSAAGQRYRDSTGATLTGVSGDLRLDPMLKGGTPFVEDPSTLFDYHPGTGSPLKGQGYSGEDVGAFDAP
ncbi:MAG: carboxypeptidase regulatory-like domain-containing protein [Candidatus Ozemobacteraceae bacterium]